MPWIPIGHGKYKSPSGRTWTRKQINAYKATNGFKRKPRRRRKK